MWFMYLYAILVFVCYVISVFQWQLSAPQRYVVHVFLTIEVFVCYFSGSLVHPAICGCVSVCSVVMYLYLM
jgi:hypothetical protein